MSTLYPIPRQTRQAILTAAANQAVFGPFDFLLFDAADVLVQTLTAPATTWAVVDPATYTVAPASPYSAFPAPFTVTLNTGLAAGVQIWIKGDRLPARTTDVTQGGAIRSVAIEAELDRHVATEQELRRDVDGLLAGSAGPVLASGIANNSTAPGGSVADALSLIETALLATSSTAIKAPVRVATTGPIARAGLQTVDGIALAAGDRVLDKDATDATTRGIWVASADVWMRAIDFDAAGQVVNGTQILVDAGTVNADSEWVVTASNPITPGTTALTFANKLDFIAPFYPVYHPASGNFQGAGDVVAHQLIWSDANPQFNADVMQFFSSDPSAVEVWTVGGTATTGDVITLHFIWGANDVSVSYTVKAGDTLATIAAGLITAIANNPTLFSLNGWTCVNGAFVAPNPRGKTMWGGYASGALIGMIVPTGGGGFAFDYDSTKGTLAAKYTVTGGATETITFGGGFQNGTYVNGGSTAGTTYQQPNAWDNNPAIVFGRAVSGMAPPVGSVLGAWYITGADSASSPLGTRDRNYGDIAFYVGDSTSGHLQGAWIIQAAGTGSFSGGGGGTWFGQGCYSNWGGAPLHGGTADMGPGTFNAGIGYYIANTYFLGQVLAAPNQLVIESNNGTDPIVLSAAAGVGVNTSPTGNTLTSALGAFFTGAQVPTTGAGLSLAYGANQGTITAKDYGAGTFKNLVLQGALIQLAPSGNGAQGVSHVSNELYPTTDNQILLGDTATPHRWASVATMTATFGGATSGNTTLAASAVASGTLTLPAATDTLIARATADTLTNKTFDTAGAGNVLKINGTAISAVTGAGAVALAASPTFTGTVNVAALTASGTVTAATLTSTGNLNGAGNLTINNTTGVLSENLTATTNQVQVTYTGSGGVAYFLKDSAAGANQKYFQLNSSGGVTALKDLTDAGGAQHTYITFTHASGNMAFNQLASGMLQVDGSGTVSAGTITANGSVATTMTSLGPTGSHTTIQEWMAVKGTGGVTRYIPLY